MSKAPLRLRIHISEPFDFERQNGFEDLFGTTPDHDDDDSDEWEIALEESFEFNEAQYDRILIGPHYVGEHLSRVHDAMLGVPVRIAHRTNVGDGTGWHFAMTGMLSLAPPPREDQDAPPDTGTDTGSGTAI